MYKVIAIDDPTATNGTRWEKDCESLQEAVDVYEGFTDWGFANEFSTVNIYTPAGKCYTKVFYREGRRVVTK